MNFGRMGAGVGRMGRFGGMRPAARLLAGEASGAAFDFVNMDMMIRGGGLDWSGDPNLKLTYTSPSTKWVRNASGVYVSGTTLRTDYLANGTALGLLIEGQRTNVLLRSQDFSHSDWSKTDTTVTADATTSPDGTANADLLTEGTAGTALTAQTGTATTASVAVAGAIFLKASANITWAKVTLTDGSGTTGVDAWVNLSTGAIGTVTAKGTATGAAATSEQAANGFWRVKLTATFQSGVSNARMIVQSASADNSNTRVNNAAYYAWQAQAGIGPYSSSPIVTTSATVTRAADDIKILLSQLPFDLTKGTLLAKVVPGSIASGSKVIAILREDANNYIQLYISTAARGAFGFVGGVTQFSFGAGQGSAVVGAPYKSALSFKANDFAFSAGGIAAGTDTSGSLPTPTVLNLGSYNGASSHLEGWLQQLIYLPRDMSDAELVSWST